jgi:hypothetical protein
MSHVWWQPLRKKCNKRFTGAGEALLAPGAEPDMSGGSRRAGRRAGGAS